MLKEIEAKGIVVLSVSLDEKETNWRDATIKDKISWVSLWCPVSQSDKLAKDYNIKGFPTTYLIGKDGVILVDNLSVKELLKEKL